MMMMDQMLDLPPPLKLPLVRHNEHVTSALVLQVILVQVNPGETFTIRTEDGALQCIQGPAEVPMMSPNGSIPPIHVPPGYVSQVTGRNGSGPCVGVAKPLSHNEDVISPLIGEYPFLGNTFTKCDSSMQQPNKQLNNRMLHPSTTTNRLSLSVCLCFSGEELQYTLNDLRPATDYHVRVSTVCNSVKGPSSDARAFTTHSDPPDNPLPPRLSHRTKSSLTLQWKPPADNGSKITNYVLEWDEGKKNSIFREYYVGHQRHCKVMRLCPAVGYTFRVAALNDIGTSGFSTEVLFYTTGSLPQTSLPPRLVQTGPSWVTLEWTRPNSCSTEEVVTYTLEMQDETKLYGGMLHLVWSSNISLNCRPLQLIICSGEWCSAPSSLLVCKTTPDRPGPPVNPAVNTVTYHSFCVTWEPPQDDGGSGDLTYVLEISEGNSEGWATLYRGPERKHLCEDRKPATSYSLRLSCVNVGGQSQCSDDLTVCTHIPPPGRCQPPSIVGNVKHREMTLQWGENAPGPTESFSPIFFWAVHEGSEPTEVYCGCKAECTVGNLLPGTTYRFQVRAANSAGYGPYSESVEISTAAGPPGQCSPPAINVTSHTCAEVTWENKESSGIDISEYRLDWGRDLDSLELVYSGTETYFQISNLEASTDYCCRLQAVNQAGAGPYSDLVTCQSPAAAPDVVSGFRLVDHPLNPTESEPFSHSTSLALTWDEPHCNGAEMTSYSISVGDSIITTGNVTCHIIRDLLPDSEYSLQIRAENEMGPGPFSQTLTVRTRPLPPSPPRLECAAVGPQSLKLRWGFSSRSQLTEDTTYVLQMEDRNQRFVVVYRGPSHTFKLQRLSESSRYRFRIQAVSEAGEGPFSETYTFCTTKSLPQTLKAPRVVQLEGNAREVTWESIPPMRGDRISYVLQVLGGREADYKQVYKGDETSFQLSGLQWNTDYRVRVFACRRCADTLQELCGSFSPSAHFNLRRSDATLAVEADVTRVPMGSTLTDEQFAGLMVFGVASLSVLMAFLLQVK
uniref:Fibronectin type III domain containing 3Bb n=1 Tax=Cyprinus carpio TaxID=7962 RepID=A0A8C1G0Y1_CYPCA